MIRLLILFPIPYAVVAVVPYALTFFVIRRKPNCIVLPPIAVGRPILNIDVILFLSNLKFLKSRRISWFLRLNASIAIAALGILAISVASAAPEIPILNTIRKTGSIIRLSDTPRRLRSIGRTVSPCDCFTDVYRLIIKRNGRSSTTILKYEILK